MRICRFAQAITRRDIGDDRAEQADELAFDALSGLQNFLVVERLIENSGGRIGDAGNPKDANSAMARGNDFRNRGHAHQIGADGAQVANFRGSFVAWAGERGIDAFVQIDAEAAAFCERQFAESSCRTRGSCPGSAAPKRSSLGPISGLAPCKLM